MILRKVRIRSKKNTMHEQDTRNSLSKHNVLIVGLARDCKKRIRQDVLSIFQAARQCRTLSWLIIESDSNDRTVDALIELRDEIPSFRVISLGSLRESLPLRIPRIAYCRNVYLAELQSNPLYANVDYVIVADLDGMNGMLTTSGLLSCWDNPLWDVCTANQRGPYYDVLALRHKLWCANDCWRQSKFLIDHGVRREAARYAATYSKMITIPEDAEWIEVDSAFGGLAVYRRAALTGLQYIGLDDDGNEICEHIALHAQIRTKGGRIFINPRLINTCETEHSRRKRLLPRLGRYRHDFLQWFRRAIVDRSHT